MAASRQTVKKIVDVLEKHIAFDTIVTIVDELSRVEGNTSFRDTIGAIRAEMNRREVEGRFKR